MINNNNKDHQDIERIILERQRIIVQMYFDNSQEGIKTPDFKQENRCSQNKGTIKKKCVNNWRYSKDNKNFRKHFCRNRGLCEYGSEKCIFLHPEHIGLKTWPPKESICSNCYAGNGTCGCDIESFYKNEKYSN